MESIPFSETRNYVQRVLENLQVYRSRLNEDASVPLLIEDDLRRGSQPVLVLTGEDGTGATGVAATAAPDVESDIADTDDAAVSLTDEASEALEDGEAPNESDR